MKTPDFASYPLPGVPVKFCFTHALPNGAWLRFDNGARDWFSFAHIRHHLGQAWIDAQMTKTGWMTGCEIDCVKV